MNVMRRDVCITATLRPLFIQGDDIVFRETSGIISNTSSCSCTVVQTVVAELQIPKRDGQFSSQRRIELVRRELSAAHRG